MQHLASLCVRRIRTWIISDYSNQDPRFGVIKGEKTCPCALLLQDKISNMAILISNNR